MTELRLRYGIVTRTASYWHYYVAVEKGLFAREGLAVEVVETGSTRGGVEALRDRQIDVAGNAPDMVIEADLAGAGLCLVGGKVNRQLSSLMARPTYRTFDDLRGARVALGPSHSGTAILIEEMLRRRGLGPGDYRPVDVGSTSARLARALEEDSVDVVLLTQPYDFLMQDRGYQRLAFVDEVVPDYPFACLAVRRVRSGDENAALGAFLRASVAAGAWLYDPTNAGEAAQILAEATGLGLPLAERTHALYFGPRPALARGVELPVAGIEQVLGLMAAAGRVATPPPRAMQFVDTRPAEEAGLEALA